MCYAKNHNLSEENLLVLLPDELKRRTEEVGREGEVIGLLDEPALGKDEEASVFMDCKGSHNSSDRMRLFIMF